MMQVNLGEPSTLLSYCTLSAILMSEGMEFNKHVSVKNLMAVKLVCPVRYLAVFQGQCSIEQQKVFYSYLALFARVGLLRATVTNVREGGGLLIGSEKCYGVGYGRLPLKNFRRSRAASKMQNASAIFWVELIKI